MTTSFQQPPPRIAPRNVGRHFWAAIACGALGFLVSVELFSSTSADGVQTSCHYTDLGAILFGGLTAVLAVVALRANPRRHVSERLPTSAAAVLTVGLLALAVFHVLSGLGTTGGPCAM